MGRKSKISSQRRSLLEIVEQKPVEPDEPVPVPVPVVKQRVAASSKAIFSANVEKGKEEPTVVFHLDFYERCRQAKMCRFPTVVPRPRFIDVPRPPQSVTAAEDQQVEDMRRTSLHAQESKLLITTRKINRKTNFFKVFKPPTESPAQWHTFSTKNALQYFQPCLQTEQDLSDKESPVTAVFVRGWRVDPQMMAIFHSCFVKLEKLLTINLWKVGLTGKCITLLADLLKMCPNLKNVNLDANPVEEENYFELIKVDRIEHLSLRHCCMTDAGVCKIGPALGTPKAANARLLTLDLAGNFITDVGAESLAKGLRTNRTLLVLSLANNKIQDRGAERLAEILCRFPLSHEEIVARRQNLSGTGHVGAVRSTKHVSRSSKKQRESLVPLSGKLLKSETSASKGRDKSSSPPGFSENDPKGTTKGKSLAFDQGSTSPSHLKVLTGEGGNETKASARKASILSRRPNTVQKTKKTTKGETKSKDKRVPLSDSEQKSAADAEREKAEKVRLNKQAIDIERSVWSENGELWMRGNNVVTSLNLSRNMIGEPGLQALVTAVQYQNSQATTNACKMGSLGLLRLCVHKNSVRADNPVLRKLEELMRARDPIINKN